MRSREHKKEHQFLQVAEEYFFVDAIDQSSKIKCGEHESNIGTRSFNAK